MLKTAQIYFVHLQVGFVIFPSHSPFFPINAKSQKLSFYIKKGLKTDLNNISPISLLPLVSKIIERIIHDQTMNFLSDNNELYKYQSSFRKFHSTDICLLNLHGKITKGFDSGLLTGWFLLIYKKHPIQFTTTL